MIDKSEAVRLRELGHTYKEIAETMSVSESWCKKELSGVIRGTRPSDETKLKAIQIIEEAMEKIRLL